MTNELMGIRGRTMQVSEIFHSFQGEGPSSGERAIFLRLAGCNLSCRWCDSAFTWDWTRFDRAKEVRSCESDDVALQISTLSSDRYGLLVVTGGEPLIQQSSIAKILDALKITDPNMRCEIETNGTRKASDALCRRVHRFVVSPKLENSHIDVQRRVRLPVLRNFAKGSRNVFKFVVESPAEFEEIGLICDAAGISPRQVWIMPQSVSPTDCLVGLGDLAGPTLDAGYNLSNRLHVLLWGDERGR
jgi:7-carboxy-7-deazaguanine synthase